MLKYLSVCSAIVGLILILPSSLPPSASEPDPEPPDVMEGQTKFIPLMEVCGGGEGEGGGGGGGKYVVGGEGWRGREEERERKFCIRGGEEVKFVSKVGGGEYKVVSKVGEESTKFVSEVGGRGVAGSSS